MRARSSMSSGTRDGGAACSPRAGRPLGRAEGLAGPGRRAGLSRPAGNGDGRRGRPDRGVRPIVHGPALLELGDLGAGLLEDPPHLRQGPLDDLPGGVLPGRPRRLRPAQLPPPAARGLLVLGDQAGVLPIDGRRVVVLLGPGAVVGVVGELAAPNGDDRVPHEPVLGAGGQPVERPVGDGQRLQHRVARGGLRLRQPRLRRVGREGDPLLVGDRHHHRRRLLRRRSRSLCRGTSGLHPSPPATNAGLGNVVAEVAGAPGRLRDRGTGLRARRRVTGRGTPRLQLLADPRAGLLEDPPQLQQVALEDRPDGVRDPGALDGRTKLAIPRRSNAIRIPKSRK